MNIIISLIYAPLVFISLRYFDIKVVSILLFIFSIVWFALTIKKKSKEYLYPLFYIVLSIMAYLVEDFLVLKVIPLIISITFTFIILLSYLNKNSIILYFANKFSKNKIDKKEQEYIHQSTLFWIGISSINICFHLSVFFSDEIDFWIYYSSIGWYGVFAIAGFLQFLHRKFVFLKDRDV
jgi:hypothetical protein